MEKNTSRSLVLGGAATLASVLIGCDAHQVYHNEKPEVTLEEMDGTPIETLNDQDLARANGCTSAIVLPTFRGNILAGDEVFRVKMSDRDGPHSLDANFYSVADQLQVDLTGGVNEEHSVSWDVRLTATGEDISRGTYLFGVASGDDGLCHDTRVCLFGSVIPGDSYDAGSNGVTPEAECTTDADCDHLNYVGTSSCSGNNVTYTRAVGVCGADSTCSALENTVTTSCGTDVCSDGTCVDAPEPVTPTATLTITYDTGAPVQSDLLSGGDVNFYRAALTSSASLGTPTFSLNELYTGAGDCFGVSNQEPNFRLVSDDGVTRQYEAFFDVAREFSCAGTDQNEEQITASARFNNGYSVSESLVLNGVD